MESSGETKVWAKGDKCMSPFSGDSNLYKGIIKKLRKSPHGEVFALIRFEGYGEEESEEINVSQLQGIKPKERVNKKPQQSYEPEGMFKPLQGRELADHLKAKYEADEDNEDPEVEVKREMLTQTLFERKTKSPSSAGNHSGSTPKTAGSRKGIVAVGGEPVRGRKRSGNSRVSTPKGESGTVSDEAVSPVIRRKRKLDVTGGAALQPDMELITSRPRISDISSIVDPVSVKSALSGDREGGDRERRSRLPTVAMETGKDKDTSCDSGFDDSDMEKPKFSFTPCGAKVPYILSEPGETPVIQVTGTINQYLRDYQREGIQFLYNHYKCNRGAILGDDMGLGKTVQVIGFLSALLYKHGNRVDVMRQKPRFIRKLSETTSISADHVVPDPFLIIGPGCVLYNWLEELETWGYFTVRKFHGTDKQECLADIKKGKVEIVVTTFETFREHQKVLNSISWSAVIADEEHKIKGLKAQTTQALRGITTPRRFGLTGTALQNNLLELWCLMDWAQPDCLGRLVDFEDDIVKPIEMGQRHDANKRELAQARKRKEEFARIRKEMMIRRTKKLISDQLPKKDDNVVFCRLSQLQVTMYQTILDHKSMYLVLHMSDPCPCDSGRAQSKCCYKKTKEGQSVKALMFTFMHLLLKVSNHVALLIPRNNSKASEKQAQHARQICKAAFAEHPEFMALTKEASFKTLSDPKYCGKMKILQGLLKVFYKEHSKVLLFSYSTQVLDILEQYMMTTEYEYRRIDGSVSPKKRMVIVREFNTDPNLFICLISTKAGGLGLNLTGANKVVIFDPNWNPTHDLQAQDRAYRIGQRRNVQVYRLVSAGTIEENMYLRQIYKQQLLNVSVEDENARRYFYAVQGNPRQKGELFGIKNMFQLQTGDSCLTMDILKRNQRVETTLAGCEMAKYVPPPVVRVEEDEDWEEESGHTPGLDSAHSEEDLFEKFFASQAAVEDIDEDEEKSDSDDNDSIVEKETKKNTKKNSPNNKSTKSTRRASNKDSVYDSEKNSKKRVKHGDLDTDDSVDNDEGSVIEDSTSEEENARNTKSHNRGKVRFQEDLQVTRTGKVRPFQSRTGKGLARAGREPEPMMCDQTLAGTFNDVSDVFDQCGVVHIHENVRVVGGSKAEDHMTRCALNDVYELHQNSQELAVQCEPMSESEEGEEEKNDKKKEKLADHNIPRSTVVGSSKVLIGQTPKFFRRKQIEGLSKFHGTPSLLEFAEKVLKSSVEERIDMLNQYYENTNTDLKNILKVQTPKKDEKKRQNLIKKAKQDNASKKRKKNSTQAKKRSGIEYISRTEETEHRGSANGTVSLELSLQETSDELDGPSLNTAVKKKRGTSGKTQDKSVKKTKVLGPRKKNNVDIMEQDEENSDSEVSVDKSSDSEQHWFDVGPISFDIGPASNQRCLPSGKRLVKENSGENVDDLLHEMSRGSIELGDSKMKMKNRGTGNSQNSEVSRNKYTKTDRKNVVVGNTTKKNKVGDTKLTSDTSILDELFSDFEPVSKKRKPPPSKPNIKNQQSPSYRSTSSKHSPYISENVDCFKEVDEIFSAGRDSVSDISDLHLDTSTLKEDGLDCFSDPTKWKKRRKRMPEKKSVVDKLIADSEAEFNDLFTSGKLRKKSNADTERTEKCEKHSYDELDGSESLF